MDFDKKGKKWIIWQNLDLDIADWDFSFWEEEGRELTFDEKFNIMLDENYESLEEERCNLNVKLDGEIIIIANLGLWYGRRSGYRIIESGNIADCLYDRDCEYLEWYCDKYDFRCNAHHHDGSNHYLYREIRPELTDTQRENFLYKLTHGEINERTLRRYTKSIRPVIASIYGWD